MNRVLLLFVAASLLGSGALLSRPQEAFISLEVIDVTYRESFPDLYFLNGDGYEKLKIAKDARGRSNQVRYTPQLQLYREAQQEGATIHEPVLTIELPPDLEQAIMFFYITADGALGHSVVNDIPDGHRGGQVRLINLTSQDVACMVNQQRILLSAGGEATEDVYSEARNFHFAFGLLKPVPHRSPFKRLPLRLPNHRVLIVISYRDEESSGDGENNQPELVPFATQMYDRVRATT